MISMRRRAGLPVILTLLVGLLGGTALATEPARKPNVLVMVSDDHGYADVGCHGCKDIPTPNLDSLAKNGIRCSQGYVSAPQCSPTRAGLLTGRYQQRFGHEHNDALPGNHLPLTETMLAARLKALGYVTGIIGKWHLGEEDEKYHPQARGFDEFFGHLGSRAHPYFGNDEPRNMKRRPILRGKEPVAEKEYTTHAYAREAIAFIENHRKEPFFLYLAFNAPHVPLQAPDDYLQRFKGIQEEKRRIYAAMVSAMDDAVGKVLAKLRNCGLEDDTLIFFISDNGGQLGAAWNGSSNLPFRGKKGDLIEGGVHVPFFVQWKAGLRAGKVYDRPVIQLDIYPTAIAAAGGEIKADWKLDGVNLLPYLKGESKTDPHEVLYWRIHMAPQPLKWAIRQGDWKLVHTPEPNEKQGSIPLRLFDLSKDPNETTDLAAKEPERVKALEALWKHWNAELPKPPKEKPE